MNMNWASVIIEVNDGKMEWITSSMEDKPYDGYWQTAKSLLTEEDEGDELADCGWMK